MEQKGIPNMPKVEIKWNIKKWLIDWKEDRKREKRAKMVENIKQIVKW